MIDVEPHIDLTTDDLLFLVDRIGAQRPVGLDELDGGPQPPPDVRDWLQKATERSLQARGILDHNGQSHTAIAEIINTTGSPGLIVSVSTQRQNIIETAVVAAVPDLAVVHTPLAPGVHRLTPIATVDVVHRVSDLVELHKSNGAAAGAGSDDELRIDLTSLDPVTSAAAESTAAAAAAAREAGLPPDQADKLAALVADRDATHLVTVMHRSPDVQMGVVSWWSAGERGLWQVQSIPGGNGEQLVLMPTTAAELLDAVRSHLPGVLSLPD